jgi:hypothetical protein
MQDPINADHSILHLLTAMRETSQRMTPSDPRKPFHDTYLRTTEAVAGVLQEGGFIDVGWVERWDVVFAGLYLRALQAHLDGRPVPGPWRVAFGAGDQQRQPPLRLVLLGMNAHVNYDLPLSLVAVIADSDWDDAELMARRAADHSRIDAILARRVAAEDRALAAIEQPGDRTVLDRLLTPFNRIGTKRFLAEARAKVWNNARLLAMARREGVLEPLVEKLEILSTQRVEDLVRPGQVIIELARHGFGVELQDRP